MNKTEEIAFKKRVLKEILEQQLSTKFSGPYEECIEWIKAHPENEPHLLINDVPTHIIIVY